jgi:hypothetical protein
MRWSRVSSSWVDGHQEFGADTHPSGSSPSGAGPGRRRPDRFPAGRRDPGLHEKQDRSRRITGRVGGGVPGGGGSQTIAQTDRDKLAPVFGVEATFCPLGGRGETEVRRSGAGVGICLLGLFRRICERTRRPSSFRRLGSSRPRARPAGVTSPESDQALDAGSQLFRGCPVAEVVDGGSRQHRTPTQEGGGYSLDVCRTRIPSPAPGDPRMIRKLIALGLGLVLSCGTMTAIAPQARGDDRHPSRPHVQSNHSLGVHHAPSHSPSYSTARPYYGGGHHTTSHGGHYVGGVGSSHQGGHYVNSHTGNHYGRHK